MRDDQQTAALETHERIKAELRFRGTSLAQIARDRRFEHLNVSRRDEKASVQEN